MEIQNIVCLSKKKKEEKGRRVKLILEGDLNFSLKSF